MGFFLNSGESRLPPGKNELGKKHRNMPLWGGFGLFALPYGLLRARRGLMRGVMIKKNEDQNGFIEGRKPREVF